MLAARKTCSSLRNIPSPSACNKLVKATVIKCLSSSGKQSSKLTSPGTRFGAVLIVLESVGAAIASTIALVRFMSVVYCSLNFWVICFFTGQSLGSEFSLALSKACIDAVRDNCALWSSIA